MNLKNRLVTQNGEKLQGFEVTGTPTNPITRPPCFFNYAKFPILKFLYSFKNFLGRSTTSNNPVLSRTYFYKSIITKIFLL